MDLLRWIFNTAVTIAVALLLGRALVEYLPTLYSVPLFGRLVTAWDPTLQAAFEAVGLPWSRDVRGLGLPAAAVTLIVVRTLIVDTVDRLIAPPPSPAGAGEAPEPPEAAAPQAGSAPPAVPAGDPAATVLTSGTSPGQQPIQSVTGTALLTSRPGMNLKPMTIGRYQVLEELGHGAMGRVYKAEDPKIGRTVAIKTLSAVGLGPEMEQYRARFELEARSAGRLSHPGVVAVHDVVDDDYGRPCLVLEFVNGNTLDRMTAEAPLSLAVALDYVSQVARALDYAHGQGIVHRDVKPANIMVTANGQAKLSDFGIAKIEGTTLTVAGQVLGTPAFMSPEQCQGNPVDLRSDIFSLGTVLYTVLTGIKPFPGDTFTAVAYKVVHGDFVALRDIDPRLPAALDNIVAQCLAKEAADRYSSAGKLADDLDAVRATLAREASAQPAA